VRSIIHDLAMVKGAPLQEGSEPSITYRGVDPDGVSFVVPGRER